MSKEDQDATCDMTEYEIAQALEFHKHRNVLTSHWQFFNAGCIWANAQHDAIRDQDKK